MSGELNRNINKFNHFIFLLKIFYFIICISISKGRLLNLIYYSSEINMIINGNGTQIIINDSFYPPPSEVYVNGIYQNSCKIFCEMEYEINNVTLIFNETMNSTEIMFSGLDNLLEIDLSLFDFSNIISMENMFRNCCNLEKINFGNINTSSVVNMRRVFYNCTNLISLDVSNFDTSLDL